MTNLEFYKSYGIDLEIHNGVKSYAFNKVHSLELLKKFERYNILIEGIDILYKYGDYYEYLIESEKYVNWELSDLNKEQRYEFLEEKIRNYSIVKDIENIAFTFTNELSFNIWKTIHNK